ncbi:DUF2167 domain-containing protein [Massilia pseudoviolaceinigra]|uniref:DUF2167 domain-containing protein n=1 Tax=Massilia pseudoviolaceinigra TaxID=3057165 RepID=UPI00279681CF|nr:DUF2167 domain-containing protein [Massilia sp. CCM 9206]MDQ1922737.1 DUF2167 domain-containing protein [Massilia sp. CCM 9206]
MFRHLSLALFLLALGCMTGAHAQGPGDDKAVSVEQFVASLKPQGGKIDLPGGLATLNLPDSFRYLTPADTERVLVQAWGNPPGHKTLGMIVPASGVMGKDGWGVIVTYEGDGHVKDSDADTIKYDELLKDMQEAVLEANSERKSQGYAAMQLVGWAEKPSYEKSTHKMFWAKELSIAGENEHSLNYNIRVLGREGVLVLNAVATMDQIAGIRQEMRKVTAFSDFTPGNRYADYNPATDKAAEYGLAALVAGGVASKLGLFGKLLALLLAFKKLIFIALGTAGVAAWNFFRGKRNDKVDLSK